MSAAFEFFNHRRLSLEEALQRRPWRSSFGHAQLLMGEDEMRRLSEHSWPRSFARRRRLRNRSSNAKEAQGARGKRSWCVERRFVGGASRSLAYDPHWAQWRDSSCMPHSFASKDVCPLPLLDSSVDRHGRSRTAARPRGLRQRSFEDADRAILALNAEHGTTTELRSWRAFGAVGRIMSGCRLTKLPWASERPMATWWRRMRCRTVGRRKRACSAWRATQCRSAP